MIALLKKDIFVMDKQMRVLVILALIFNLIPSASSLGATYAMLIALMMPMSTVSYDERCKWDRYAAMLPWTPRQIVGSKYILSYVAMALGVALITFGNFARGLYSEASDWGETGSLVAIYLVVIVAVTAVVYPLIYRFGSEKGRLVMVAIFAAIFVLAFGTVVLAIDDMEGAVGRLKAVPAPVLAAIAVVVLAGITFLSYRLSVKFYLRRREGAYT